MAFGVNVHQDHSLISAQYSVPRIDFLKQTYKKYEGNEMKMKNKMIVLKFDPSIRNQIS